MTRLSRIATGTGDKGDTGLFGGARVSKHHPRVEAYGAVDELNSVLGLVHAMVDGPQRAWVERIQRELFVLGADLATPGTGGPRVKPAFVERLDAEIDTLESAMPPLKRFILPSGDELAARYHAARAVCRRAERTLVAAMESERDGVNQHALVYLNRLNDLLFLKARERSLATGSEVRMDFGDYA